NAPPAPARSRRTTSVSSRSTSAPRARRPSPPNPPRGPWHDEDATEPRRVGASLRTGGLARSPQACLATAHRRAARAEAPRPPAPAAGLAALRPARTDADHDRRDRHRGHVPDALPAAGLGASA